MQSNSQQDILIRSRVTILDLLEARGYDATPYRKMIGVELVKLINTPEALSMELKGKTNPEKKSIVYYTSNNIKTTVSSGNYVMNLLDGDINPETTEVMIILMADSAKTEGETDSYSKGALQAWQTHKLKIQFWPMVRLVNNPMNHVLQPKFEIVPEDQHDMILKENYVKSKTQFPFIKFHKDPVARALGLLPLDLIRITRPSPTAGEYQMYRVCVP
jgi:DNA-directed RNA polymerase subunit H (RpoH/RPB5)